MHQEENANCPVPWTHRHPWSVSVIWINSEENNATLPTQRALPAMDVYGIIRIQACSDDDGRFSIAPLINIQSKHLCLPSREIRRRAEIISMWHTINSSINNGRASRIYLIFCSSWFYLYQADQIELSGFFILIHGNYQTLLKNAVCLIEMRL